MNVRSLSYLKCPVKIQRALRDYGEPVPPVEVIERQLAKIASVHLYPDVGEPTQYDGNDFRVQGLITESQLPKGVTTITPKERDDIARIVARIGNSKPKPRAQSFRHNATNGHASTGFADALVSRVCDGLGISLKEFLGASRKKRLVAARALVVRVLRERNSLMYSYPRCAAIVGRKDHTTMIHAYHNFETYCAQFPEVAKVYDELREGVE